MTTLATRWHTTTRRALPLDPHRLALTICADPIDTGIRAANTDPRTTSGTRPDSHPERMAGRTRTDTRQHRRTLRTLNQAVGLYIDSVAALNAECQDAGPPDTWAEAVHDAHLLDELDLVQAAADVGRNVAVWVLRAETAVHAIRRIDQHWRAKPASAWTQYTTDGGRIDQLCDIHASLTPPVFRDAHRRQLCRTCYGLWQATSHRPPAELIGVLEHGTQTEYRRARQTWFDSLGITLAG